MRKFPARKRSTGEKRSSRRKHSWEWSRHSMGTPRNSENRISERQRTGDCKRNVRIFPQHANALPLFGERVAVRGNQANSNPKSRTALGTVKLSESPGRAGAYPI